MSEQTIYNALRAGGLSSAGACAVMGNMFMESSMRSNIVEKRCSMSDFDYTRAVDTGTISKHQFIGDAYGYGLCQWTYFTRKAGLYELAKSKGVSISDEQMQCEYCIQELHTPEFAELYKFLCQCSGDELHTATGLVCAGYEKPAVNNVQPRYEAAKKYFDIFQDEEACTVADACPIHFVGIEQGMPYVEIGVPQLKLGDSGRHVSMLQAGLRAMGYYLWLVNGNFDKLTENAVKKMQAECNQPVTGVVDQGTWQVLFQ